MSETRNNDAWTAARRCLQAAIEHVRKGDMETAEALLRARRRYVERFRREAAGLEIRTPPAAHALRQGGSLRMKGK